jgi:hypothetical protein
MTQLHKRFTSDQIQELLERYLKKTMERKYIQEVLGIKKRRFFTLVQQYEEDPEHFTIPYQRPSPPRIDPPTERNILKELTIEKAIIQKQRSPPHIL